MPGRGVDGGVVVVVVIAVLASNTGPAGRGDDHALLLVGRQLLGVGGTLLIGDGLARLVGHRGGRGAIRAQLHLNHPDGLVDLRIADLLARMRGTLGRGTHLRRDRPLEHPDLHGVTEIGTGIEHRRGVTGVAQSRRDGIPAEPHQMHTHARIHRHTDTGNHVGIAGHQHHVRTLPPVGGLDHVRDQQRVHGLLGATVTPLDQLTGPQLHALDHPQGPLIPVGTRIGDTVVPVLALDRLVHQTVGDLI